LNCSSFTSPTCVHTVFNPNFALAIILKLKTKIRLRL
jgi:hypothetical protein